MTDTTGPAGLKATGDRRDAGRRLRHDYWEMFGTLATVGPNSATEWESAAAHGATLGWALQTAGATADQAVTDGRVGYLVLGALRLASAAPVGDTGGLLADGWTLNELSELMSWTGAAGYPKTVRQLKALHRAVLDTGGPGNDFVWHAGAAVLTAVQAKLTDLQAFRWLQAIDRGSEYFGWLDHIRLAPRLKEWAAAAGPDGWAWAAAGYSPEQARVLLGLPETHPDRPGPEQLAVMAALRT